MLQLDALPNANVFIISQCYVRYQPSSIVFTGLSQSVSFYRSQHLSSLHFITGICVHFKGSTPVKRIPCIQLEQRASWSESSIFVFAITPVYGGPPPTCHLEKLASLPQFITERNEKKCLMIDQTFEAFTMQDILENVLQYTMSWQVWSKIGFA